ncbi:MAG TPA: TlpA family protein disulfide reductase [Planctomycetes bacterium]|nr:TlpA family protein disulfide reductase [Planctomycetota bacterium]
MPHLKELVELYEDQPFELIGINTADSEEDYRAGVEKHEMTWLSAFQGDEPEITRTYQIAAFPTYILLDPDGRILYRGHDGKAVNEPLAKLMAKLKEKDAGTGATEEKR